MHWLLLSSNLPIQLSFSGHFAFLTSTAFQHLEASRYANDTERKVPIGCPYETVNRTDRLRRTSKHRRIRPSALFPVEVLNSNCLQIEILKRNDRPRKVGRLPDFLGCRFTLPKMRRISGPVQADGVRSMATSRRGSQSYYSL